MRIGIVGLGVMGRNMARRLIDAGHDVTAFDPWPEARLSAADIPQVKDWDDLCAALPSPRVVLLMVKAGQPVDDAIAALRPRLGRGDVLIDGGNSFWRDTERRQGALEAQGVALLGCGISGGREGARYGACLMAGGSDLAWTTAAPALRALAAAGPDGPACRHVGPGGSGHFVKMAHNGVEYAVMQALAEADELLAWQGLPPDGRAGWFAGLSGEAVGGYLQEITVEILSTSDPQSGAPMLEVIDDAAGQKGTGGWTVSAALELGVAAPSLAEAVFLRSLSGSGALRASWREAIDQPAGIERDDLTAALAGAVFVSYLQGFELLRAASAAWEWSLDLPAIAKLWRAGSILRANLLEPLSATLSQGAPLADPWLRDSLVAALPGWRRVVAGAATAGLPAPVLAAGLGYLDALGRARLPTAMIQAQRDRFGDHGFARRNEAGVHHGPWSQGEEEA